MRGRSDGAIERMSKRAAMRAGCFGLLLTACFEDPPATEDTSTGPTTSGATEPTTTNPSTSTDTTGETTIGTTDPPTTTETSADTTVDPTTTSDASTSTSSDESSSSDTGEIQPTFFDDFDRADSQAIGNGWIEKNPDVFSISENEVVGADDQFHQYFEQIIYQDESVADIELRVEFRIDTPNVLNEPHLVARAQPDGLVAPDTVNHCYILVPQLSQDRLCLMRFDLDGAIGGLQCADWPDSDLVVGDQYRLVMTIEGPGPVEMTGRLEHANGEAWDEVVAVEWIDNNMNQIAEPGAWGFSGGTSGNYFQNFVFDNYSAFYR